MRTCEGLTQDIVIFEEKGDRLFCYLEAACSLFFFSSKKKPDAAIPS